MKVLLFVLLLMTACSQSMPKNESAAAQPYKQESILLRSYLGNSHPAYSDAGVVDELAQFKKLEQFYIQLVEPADKQYTRDSIALIFFYALYAEQTNNAAFNEYLASDLKQVFSTSPELFAQTLAQLPLAIAPVCSRLGAKAEPTGGDTSSEKMFSTKLNRVLEDALGEKGYTICRAALEEKTQ